MKDHMSATEFHLEFESSPIAVRTALGRIIDGLGPLSLDPEEIGTVEIVMAEALNNVVEHAYPEGDPPFDGSRLIWGEFEPVLMKGR